MLFSRKNDEIKKLILSAIFLAIGFVLPMFFGQIPAIGQVLLPMHIPVFLCGIICDWKYGAIIGFILPLIRSLIFSVPVLYPTAIAVAFEMAVYGLISGLVYKFFTKKTLLSIYVALIFAMVIGRIIRFIAESTLLGFQGKTLVLKAFFANVIISGIPGIMLHLVLIPLVITTLKKAKIKF